MAKKNMPRHENEAQHPNNDMSVVPEIQGKAKAGHKKANPILYFEDDYRQRQR